MKQKFHKQSGAPDPPPRSQLTTNNLIGLGTPTRVEIVAVLRALGPSSVREIGAYLGRPQDGLYYHIRQLVGYGLVEACGRRPAGRRYETMYRLTAGEFVPGPHDVRYREALIGFCRACLTLTHRHYTNAVRDCRPDDMIEHTAAMYMVNVRVTPARFRAIKREIWHMVRRVRREKSDRGSPAVISIVMAPASPRRRRRKPPPGPLPRGTETRRRR